jgi:UDP-N-acetylglucosamine 2-epimerase (non-hydrolysing)
MKILSVFGTRPEAIKMAPVIRALGRHSRSNGLKSMTCVTAQHRQMLDQVLKAFHIRPDIDLNLMRQEQTPASFISRAVTAITAVLHKETPDLVLVQGDTTTAMAAALAASYQTILVGHVEAGLRTRNRFSPFPEELNRRMVGMLAEYHFAPTRQAAENLRAEGAPEEHVFLTGNTVIDAMLWVAEREPSQAVCQLLKEVGFDDLEHANGHYSDPPGRSNCSPSVCRLKTILVTAHRRESFGKPIENICISLREIARRNPDVQIVFPVHMNPAAREPARRILQGCERVHLIDPLPYEALVHLLKRVYLVLTDSGGIQEEAPTLGKPVLVLRRDTERPEGVEAGCARIVGTEPDRIVLETERLLCDANEYHRMAHCANPYGDGRAAERILKIILALKDTHRSESSGLVTPTPPSENHQTGLQLLSVLRRDSSTELQPKSARFPFARN